MQSIARDYHINDTNLDLRKQFIGLSTQEIKTLKKLAKWANRVAGPMAREFYDHQFSFAPTRTFYETFAACQNLSVEQLRQQLEPTQAEYFRQIFQEAAEGGDYGTSYFEQRLKVGRLHNAINLPLKWYVGSYALYQSMIRKYLFRWYWHRPRFRAKAEQAIFTVFNYDIQAVVDSFFYDHLESVGLMLEKVQVKTTEHDLSEDYKTLKATIRDTIEETARASQIIAEASSQQAHTTEQTAQATQQIAIANQEQAWAVTQSSNAANHISAIIQQVAANAKAAADGANAAAQIAGKGAATVEATLKGMEGVKAKVGLSAQKVMEMGQRSEQIGMIVETIDDIASQTNLLALNAAIEAARAGEHGKGFAVVAGEVRKLAEKSATATQEIANLIKSIQQTVAEAVAAMEESAAEVEAGVDRAHESGQVLASILGAAKGTSRQVEEIAQAADEMNASATELVEAIDNVSAVVEENAAAAQEIAAQVEEVTASAQSLSGMARELQQIVTQFNLGKDDLVKTKHPAGITGSVQVKTPKNNGHHYEAIHEQALTKKG
ncbi:MAG: methyl-accepting chemotaxis protein [Chloroflexota bacterium]